MATHRLTWELEEERGGLEGERWREVGLQILMLRGALRYREITVKTNVMKGCERERLLDVNTCAKS